jgi:uncharacterized protein YbaP (TraB family)
MRNWVAALFIAATLLTAACGPRPLGEPALWHIHDEDSDIWLFGTVHILPGDLTWRSARFDAAFAAADELVTETDVSDAQATAALAARYGLLPPGHQLSDQLPAPTRQRLARVLRGLNVDASTIEPVRPWLAALRVSFLFAMKQGQRSDAGVEAVLLPQARARGMRLSYLETGEQQIRTLADLSDADQIQFLEASLREIEEDATTLAVLQQAWAEGDLGQLERLSRDQMHEAGPAVYDALISRRNRAWSSEIETKLQGSGRTFYAVGAAHLLGDDGVVAQLRREGVRVDGP